MTLTVDPLGNRSYAQYNGWNLPVAATDALGAYSGDPLHTVTTGYDAWGRAVSLTDQLGRVTQTIYDNLGRKIEQIAQAAVSTGSQTPVSPVNTWSYDPNGNVDFTSDPLQHTTVTYFDGLNRPTCVQDALAGITSPPTSDLTPTSQPTHSTFTVYDKLGNVSSVSVSINGSTTRTTQYLYDHLSRKFEEIDQAPASGVASSTLGWGHDSDGNVISTTDSDYHKSYTVYDTLDRPVRSVDALGSGPNDLANATQTTYDSAGNVATVTDSDANTTTYQRDRWNRTVATFDALWNQSTTQYDLDSNITKTVDRDGRAIAYIHDALNRRVEEDWLDPSQTSVVHTIQTYYDPAGQTVAVTETDTSSASSTTNYQYTFDADGRMTKSRMAPGDLGAFSPVVYSADLSQNSGSIPINGVNFAASFVVNSTLNAGDHVVLSSNSPSFRPMIMLLPPSAWDQTNLSDGFNLSQAIFSNGASNGSGGSDARFAFTASQSGHWAILVVSNLTSLPSGQSEPFSLKFGFVVPTALTELDYAYNLDGTVATITDKSDVSVLSGKSGTTSYLYDPLSRVTQITQQNTSGAGYSSTGITSKTVNYTYNDDSSVDTITRNDGSLSTLVATTSYRTPTGGAGSGYDGMGRLTNMQQTFGSTTNAYSWQFDPASNITQETSVDGTASFLQDNGNELTHASYSAQSSLSPENFKYDSNGNRTGTQTVTGANNELLFDGTYTYQYDPEGNRTAKFIDGHNRGAQGVLDSSATSVTLYTWDNRNRLIEAVIESTFGGAATADMHFSYDSANRLIRRFDSVAGGAKQYLIYDGQNSYLTVSDTNGLANGAASATISQRQLYGMAVDETLATDDDLGTTGSVLWGLSDNQGTPRDIVNASGALVTGGHVSFDPFGNPEAGTSILVGFSFGEAGMRFDVSTGFYFTANRPYDPKTGTFPSQDTSGLNGPNPYAYVGNDPLTNSDPSGLGASSTLASSYFNFSSTYGAESIPQTVAIPQNATYLAQVADASNVGAQASQQDEVYNLTNGGTIPYWALPEDTQAYLAGQYGIQSDADIYNHIPPVMPFQATPATPVADDELPTTSAGVAGNAPARESAPFDYESMDLYGFMAVANGNEAAFADYVSMIPPGERYWDQAGQSAPSTPGRGLAAAPGTEQYWNSLQNAYGNPFILGGSIFLQDASFRQTQLDNANMFAGILYQGSGAGAIEGWANSVLHPIDSTVGLGEALINLPSTAYEITFNTSEWWNSKTAYQQGSIWGMGFFGITTAGLNTQFSADTGGGFGGSMLSDEQRSIVEGIQSPGRFDATVGSLAEARQLVLEALPDAVEAPEAVTGLPYPKITGTKQWFQIHPAEPGTNELPHIKYQDWTVGKKRSGGSWGHIYFPNTGD